MASQYPEPKSFEITPRTTFIQRRRLVKQLGLAVAASSLPQPLLAKQGCNSDPIKLPDLERPITDKKAATSYNNYYEFSTDKEAVRILARSLKLSPWTVSVTGAVERPLELDLDQVKQLCEEERIYRFRCVEGWSMVVPWIGVPLHKVLKKALPLSNARFVKFTSVLRPKEMIGQRRPTLAWPYTEALRIDEAMHPLTLLVTGMYGDTLPAQNGAPLRLMVPWKYGFKHIKAIQSIKLVEQQPIGSWQSMAPKEYGFYANVNPNVAHPRWSQSREVPLGQSRKQPTLMFNGYGEQVAQLYTGMDLKQHF